MDGFLKSMEEVDPESDDAVMLFACGVIVELALDTLRSGTYAAEEVESCEAAVRLVPDFPMRRILLATLNAIQSENRAPILPSVGAIARELFERRHLHAVAAFYETVAKVPGVPLDAQAIALRQHGLTLRLLGRYQESILVYSHCYTLARKLGDVEMELNARLGEATAWTEMEELDFAERIVIEVREDAAAVRLRSVEATAIGQQATIAGLRGEYQHAADLAIEAIGITRRMPGGPHFAYDRFRTILAKAYSVLGREAECLALATELWRESREPHVRSSAALLIVRHAERDRPMIASVLQWFEVAPLPAGDRGELAEIIATRGLLTSLPGVRDASSAGGNPARPARPVIIGSIIRAQTG